MSEGNKAIVRRFYEEQDKGNAAVIDELLAPDFAYHFPGIPEPMDREGIKRFGATFYSAFPDLRHAFEDQISEGERSRAASR